MEKVEISVDMIGYPMPCCLVGAEVAGKPNFLAVAFFSMVCPKPPHILVSLGKDHYTNPGIKETEAFSVNIPSAAMAAATDYCGIVSGKKYDKSDVFDVFYGKEEKAPMIRECPCNLECRLMHTINLGDDELFIGQIVAAYSDERYLTDGKPDLAKITPFLLDMPQTTYRGLGSPIGKAWCIGKSLVKR